METRTILIVDSSKEAQVLLRRYLMDIDEGFNFKILSAYSYLDALKYCKREKVQLILLDLALNRTEGGKLFLRLSKDPNLSKIPVVILSSVRSQHVIREAIKQGARGYILKPIELPKLKKAIFSIFKLKYTINDAAHHGRSEIYIKDDIIVVEIHSSFHGDFLNSVKHKLLDVALLRKSSIKRALIMILSVEDAEINLITATKFFSFYKDIKNMSQNNIKVLSCSEKLKKILSKHPDTKDIEPVPSMPRGMQILNLQLLENGKHIIRTDHIKPGSRLFSAIYDGKGNLVKNKDEVITAEDLTRLKEQGEHQLYYIKLASADSDIIDSDLFDISNVELHDRSKAIIA